MTLRLDSSQTPCAAGTVKAVDGTVGQAGWAGGACPGCPTEGWFGGVTGG